MIAHTCLLGINFMMSHYKPGTYTCRTTSCVAMMMPANLHTQQCTAPTTPYTSNFYAHFLVVDMQLTGADAFPSPCAYHNTQLKYR